MIDTDKMCQRLKQPCSKRIPQHGSGASMRSTVPATNRGTVPQYGSGGTVPRRIAPLQAPPANCGHPFSLPNQMKDKHNKKLSEVYCH